MSTESTKIIKEELPPGWRWIKLGEAAQLINGRAYSADELLSDGTYPVIRVGNLFTSDHWYYSSLELEAEKYCDAGDLLYAWSASFGPFIWTGPKVIFHYHIWKVVCSEILHREYACHALKLLTEKIKQNSHGLAMLHMTKEKMEQFELPLPPLNEQRRIAGLLREKMAAVEKARTAAQARLQAVKTLPASFLRQVFPQPGRPLPEGWQWVKLKNMATLLPSRSISSDGDSHVQAVTTACLTESGFNSNGVKPARMKSWDVKDCLIAAGEVLIARSNTPELVGRACLYDGIPEGVVASDLTIRIKATNNLSPPFLSRYLSSIFINSYWRDQAGGASGSMKKITRTQVLDLPVPCPSIAEQHRIARVLREQMDAVDKARVAVEEEVQTINALPAALLRQAFNGEI